MKKREPKSPEQLKDGISFPVEITSIKPQIRSKERVNLYNNEIFLIGVHISVIEEHGIQRGSICTEKLFDELISHDTDAKVKDKVLELIGRRSHGRTELFRKCKQKGYHESSINRALDYCEERGWIDDQVFANQFVSDKIKMKWGPQKIRAALYQKGIQKLYIEQSLNTEFENVDEFSLMLSALVKKKMALIREKDLMKRKQKTYRFLASRGFNLSSISKNLDKLLDTIK